MQINRERRASADSIIAVSNYGESNGPSALNRFTSALGQTVLYCSSKG